MKRKFHNLKWSLLGLELEPHRASWHSHNPNSWMRSKETVASGVLSINRNRRGRLSGEQRYLDIGCFFAFRVLKMSDFSWSGIGILDYTNWKV